MVIVFIVYIVSILSFGKVTSVDPLRVENDNDL